MPCPMRFGPPPSTMIFLRSVGLRFAFFLVGRIHVGGVVANSAAQESTRLYTGRTPSVVAHGDARSSRRCRAARQTARRRNPCA